MVKKGDFIFIEYTGYDNKGNVFDSTFGDIGKRLHGKEGPILLIYGYDYVIPGLFDALKDMAEGEEKELILPPGKAFGKRKRSLVKVFSMNDFKDAKFKPVPGTAIQLDTPQGPLQGVIKSVSSGRIMVDFNHPLADMTVKYKLKLVKIIKDKKEKIESMLKEVGFDKGYKIEDEKLIIYFDKKDKSILQKQSRVLMTVKLVFPEIKKVDFKIKN